MIARRWWSVALLAVAVVLAGAVTPLEEGRALLMAGDDAGALARFERAPLTFETLYLRGVALYNLGRDTDARNSFRAVLAGPREADAVYYQHLLTHRAGGVCPICGLVLTAPATSPSALPLPAPAPGAAVVRILLQQGRDPVKLHSAEIMRVTDLETGEELMMVPPSAELTVRAANGAVILGDRPGARRRVAVGSAVPLAVGPRYYRGELILAVAGDGQLRVINRLGIEEYLYGVLKKEISPTWPQAVLQAQAIAARTFALYQAGAARGRGDYDLGDDFFSQMYGGVNHEDPVCRAAVDATAGLVMRYQGKLIPAYFHSDSGGKTAGSEEVWSAAQPFLVSRDDPFSDSSPYHRWELTISGSELGSRLARHNLGTVASISVLQRSRSGRIKTINLQGSRRRITLSGNQFRVDAGPNDFRSTLIDTIEKRGRDFYFRGYGWGHGVGMAQWSAKAMAEQGWDCRQILDFFYAGIEIGAYDDAARPQ